MSRYNIVMPTVGTPTTVTFPSTGGTLALLSEAGVVGFTGSQNTASPNNTVNASRLLVDAGTTNADAVIQPKGTGAFQLQLADGTAAGGSKRGGFAIDLQMLRSTAAKVASGLRSFVAGHDNVASNDESVAIGFNNSATGIGSVAIGRGNTSSGQASVALCESNTASGLNSYTLGNLNTASNYGAGAVGIRAIADRIGMYAHAAGRFANNGDAQFERQVLRMSTNDNVAKTMTTDGNGAGATNRVTIATDSTYAFRGLLVARNRDTNNESAGYEFTGVIDNNAGTTAFVGTPTVTVLGEDVAAWDVALVADDTNDSLNVNVTGENSKIILWVCTLFMTKVSG